MNSSESATTRGTMAEVGVDALREHGREQRAGRVEQHQARSFFKREEQSALAERQHSLRIARLLADDEAAREQPLLERRNHRVAEALVVGAVRGEADVIARAVSTV